MEETKKIVVFVSYVVLNMFIFNQVIIVILVKIKAKIIESSIACPLPRCI